MRSTIEIENKSSLKVITMKKKRCEKKDTVSETISFVIKGRLMTNKGGRSKKMVSQKKLEQTKIERKAIEKRNQTKPKTIRNKRVSNEEEIIKKKSNAEAIEKPSKPIKKNIKTSPPKQVVKVPVKKNKETLVKKKLVVDGKPKEKKKQEAPKLIKKTKANPPKPSANMENKKAIVTKKKSVQALKTKIEAKTQQVKKKTNKPKQPVQKKQEEATSSPNIDSSTSDELTLDLLRKNDIKPLVSMEEAKQPKKKKLVMKTPAKGRVGKLKQKLIEEPKKRKAKLVNFGPKRHRVASLNALAKVHCLYENETRSILDTLDVTPEGLLEDSPENYLSSEEKEVFPRRNLRTVPGLRAVGKHWDFDDMTSSSDENSDGSESTRRKERDEDDDKRCGKNRRKRNRTEIIMDLKDMVVRKRMASLNATAILAASYCVEKRAVRSPKSEDESESGKKVVGADGMVKAEDDKGMIEVCATPNKKVAVILNQDTDVTITGVYVNSTTRSTHHEGYCSIAGMQYRISATSHTQTAATAVASECFNSPTAAAASSQGSVKSDSSPSKSYTPLDALSSMQPPGGDGSAASQQQVVPTVPGQRSSSETSDRHHGCSSAFTAPPSIPYGSPSRSKHPQVVHAEQNFVHGYYQPAGPLITVPHGHIQPQLIKGTPISDIVSTSPLSTGVVHPPAPSSTGDSSDNEVIITSVTAAKDSLPPPPQPQPPLSYRFGQYHGSPHHAAAYSYSYPPQYYAVAPPPAPPYSHHDMCYSPATQYLHHKYPPPSSYRRYLPSTQYYQHAAPELYGTSTVATQQTQQVTTSNTTVEANTFRPPQNPPTIMEPFPPPSSTTLVEPYPPHYYPAVQYGPIPPPSCFTHSAPSRTIPYINTAAYQTCPCPMQSCPKNVLTGPLTGDSKRSSLSKEAVPLPPVASLALPLEPASATGPPSPARGSAGMPPPPSPAGATYRSGMTPKLEATDDCKPRKARVGKNAVRNQQQQNTMLLMCQATTANTEGIVGRVKREVESPKEVVQEVAKKDAVSQETQAYNTVITTTTTTSTTTTTTPCQNCTQPEKLEIVNSSEVQNVKNEQTVTGNDKVDVEGVVVKNEEPEPCQKTVAETVKVKNMKRKLLEKDNEQKEGNEDCPQKKAKVEKVTGSYKNLIKKNPTVIRINNGKQKLESPPKRVQKSKRLLLKQKLSPTRTDSIARRLPKQQQQTKPLSSNNAHLNLKATKTEVICKEEVENVEPTSKGCKKTVKCDERTKGGCVQGRVEKDKCKKCRFQRKNGKVTCKVEPIAGKPKKGTKKTDVALAQAIAKVQRRSFQSPRWSNGWIWEGEAYEAKVFINSDETTLVRRCYPRMRHREGDIIEPGDCVLLKAGQKKNELPFVAKIAALWENPDDGEMMLSLLWYYRPEHTEQGRLPIDQPDEVFASRHKDSNSVACIEDKCYVLTYNEYCRYRKELRRLQEGVQDTPRIPIPEPYPRKQRQPPSPLLTPTDLVFYCRKVYDFRQKRMVKNPTHIYQLYQ